jgi:glycosyltransferase involved in cell wall biosynthesis
MKTIVIAHNYSEISFAAMSYHFAHYFANLGHRVVFISHNPYFSEKQILKINSGEIILCSWSTLKRPTSIRDFIWFSKIYMLYKPQIIIGHFVGSNITVLVSKILSLGKVKTVEYYHTLSDQILLDIKKVTLKHKLLVYRKKLFYKIFCDTLICPSLVAKEDLVDFFSIEKGVVLLNPMVDRFKEKISIPSDKVVISYLGRLDPSKGVIDLVQAFERYQKNNPASKIILNIAGSGKQSEEIERMVTNIPSIHFHGRLAYDQIDEYLNNSSFTIIPSKFDNLPTVGIESLMNQTPVLISNTTGLTEYLEDGKDSFKFDSNVDAIEALFSRIESNSTSIEKMSLNARNTFLEKFSIANYCEDLSKIIE